MDKEIEYTVTINDKFSLQLKKCVIEAKKLNAELLKLEIYSKKPTKINKTKK